MTKSALQEKLVALYLRLNGYTTTGLILHSPSAEKVEGEIDLIGIRFSHHSQEDRIIDCDPELQIPKETFIDIVICEVKGGNKPTLKFNESIRLHRDRTAKLLKWIGVFRAEQIDDVVSAFQQVIQTKEVQKPEPFHVLKFENISIRPILFAPDKLNPTKTQPNFIGGQKIIDFCWNCFRPITIRQTCATDYKAINNWGEQFERLVGYFKNNDLANPGKIEDIYKHFNAID